MWSSNKHVTLYKHCSAVNIHWFFTTSCWKSNNTTHLSAYYMNSHFETVMSCVHVPQHLHTCRRSMQKNKQTTCVAWMCIRIKQLVSSELLSYKNMYMTHALQPSFEIFFWFSEHLTKHKENNIWLCTENTFATVYLYLQP
jgi:hypothetical protein